MREELGISVSVKVNIHSLSTGQTGAIDYPFGVNKVPTKAEMDAVVKECLATFNNALGVTDSRLVNLGDYGFAEPYGFGYVFDE